ncbi:MAG TPA: hypothetical protein VGQ46_00170, partial [Thermoanaerobaculia bacterium]|nr:hypothetical protein [Thermoanaerobaculia bacterium]
GTLVGSAKPYIVSLKVFTCSGYFDSRWLFSAVDWISGTSNPYRWMPGVINQSGYLGPWDDQMTFQSYGDAVSRLVTATQFPFFTSADNYSADACRFSPKDRAYTNTNHSGTVFVAGGTSMGGANTPYQNTDYRWQMWNGDVAKTGVDTGSNGGGCVSVYAPAADIYAARNTGPNDYGVASGTSFSSPLTAGIAARYIANQRTLTGATPTYQQVYDFLLAQAQTIVSNATTPEYWACAATTSNGGHTFTSFPYHAGCAAGFTDLYFPSVSNTSNARMLFWDNGTCP